MNNFTITFKYDGKLFSSVVKKKVHESTVLFAVELNHEYLQKKLKSNTIVFIEHVVNTIGGTSATNTFEEVLYFARNVKDVAFEKAVWSALHEIFDTCAIFNQEQKRVSRYAMI